MQFRVGDKAVYPVHGVGVITGIEAKEIGGTQQDFYVLQIISSGATLMVPTATSAKAGMRTLAETGDIEHIWDILRSRVSVPQTTWNRRFRELNTKLSTGSLHDIAEVLRDLCSLAQGKDLSYGEKKMLDKARSLLVSEVSVVRELAASHVEQELDDVLYH